MVVLPWLRASFQEIACKKKITSKGVLVSEVCTVNMVCLEILQIYGKNVMLFSLEGWCYWCFLQKMRSFVSCAAARNQSRLSLTYLSCSIWRWRTGWRACSSRRPGRPCSRPRPCSGRWSSAAPHCRPLEAAALTCLAQPALACKRFI